MRRQPPSCVRPMPHRKALDATLRSMQPPRRRSQPSRSFRDLRVWQEALKLAVNVDRLVTPLDRGPRAKLADQLRRASNSVQSNIAEGWGRRTADDRKLRYTYAWSSLGEVEGHLIELELSNRVDTAAVRACSLQARHVGRLLTAFRRKPHR